MNAPNVPKLGSAYRTVRRNEGWQEQALCAIKFGPRFDLEAPGDQLACCRECPVTAECLDYALRTETPPARGCHSIRPIYGGLTSGQRVELRAALRKRLAS